MKGKNNIRHLLVIETLEGKINRESLETLGFALSFHDKIDDCALLIAGAEITESAASLAEDRGLDVVVFDDSRFRYPNGDLLAAALVETIKKYNVASVVLLHTITGVHAASRAAATAGMACITAVESVIREGESTVFQRCLQYGKIRASIELQEDKFILTVLTGSFAAPEPGDFRKKPGTVYDEKTGRSASYSPRSVERAESSRSLEEAEVIVSAGRGIGKEENLEMIRDVAKIFSRSAVGSSRPLCDLGWLPYGHQVGSTGKTVSPKLYMACGISGASQHLAGMKSSQIIVAVNRDPNAAIFSVADYGVVEDLTVFLPLLADKYREGNWLKK